MPDDFDKQFEDADNPYRTPAEAAKPSVSRRTSGAGSNAITSLICGIISIPASLSTCGCGICGVPFSILGIVLGVAALLVANQEIQAIDFGTSPEAGRGMAQAGKICGIIGIVFGVLFFLLSAGLILFVVLTESAKNGGL